MMKIVIERTYYPNGTNGELHIDGKLKCFTIELPWHNNERKVSCIPEGTYKLEKHISNHLGNCLHVLNVPNRSDILIHAANNAVRELLGCIAPVTKLTGPGMGDKSKVQLTDIVNQAYAAFAHGEEVILTIIKK